MTLLTRWRGPLMVYFSMLAFCGIGSCVAGDGAPATTKTEIRASLPFSVEGTPYVGTAVVQRKTSQKIAVTIPSNSAKLIFRTCHREEVYALPANPWSTYYVPVMWLENWGSCVAIVSVITQKGNLLQSYLDFSSNENLSATSYCNGQKSISTMGATFCQAREGLLQRITFDVDVTNESGTGCPEMVKTGARDFQYAMGKGLCVYAFRANDGKTHRLTSRGYTELNAE